MAEKTIDFSGDFKLVREITKAGTFPDTGNLFLCFKSDDNKQYGLEIPPQVTGVMLEALRQAVLSVAGVPPEAAEGDKPRVTVGNAISVQGYKIGFDFLSNSIALEFHDSSGAEHRFLIEAKHIQRICASLQNVEKALSQQTDGPKH